MSPLLRFQFSIIVLFLLSSCYSSPQLGVHTAKSEPSGEGLFYPAGFPVNEWNDIPIMPQATLGQEFAALTTYSFKANTTVKEVQAFYNARLIEQGWSSFFSMPGDSDGAVFIFQKDSAVLTITVMYSGRSILVLLATG